MNTTNDRTGVFRTGNGETVVVYWRGREIAKYASMAEFVEAHVDGIAALEKSQEALLAASYKDKL